MITGFQIGVTDVKICSITKIVEFRVIDISKEIEFPDQLISFIGPKSWLLFNLLNLHDEQLDWMQAPIDCWENMVGYKKIEGIVRSLEVVNDCAERAVKLISDFKDVVVNVSDQEYLFQVVQQHRAHFSSFKKDNLKTI